MRVIQGTILAVALLVPASAIAQDGDRVVPGGGITAPGWKGTIDAASAKAGRTISDSKFAKEGDALKLTQTFVYCVAYGDGAYLVRQFNGATVTTLARKTPNPAVHSTTKGGDVTNEVSWNVKGDRAECAINGTVVAGFNKADIVGAGKLDSTDGIFGLRVSHNLDVVVTGFGKAK